MCSSVAASVSQVKLNLPQRQSSFSVALGSKSKSKSSKALVASALATSNARLKSKSKSKSASSSPSSPSSPSKSSSSKKQRDLTFPSEIDGKLLLGGSHNIIFRPQFASFHVLNYGFYAPLSDLDQLTPKLRALLPPPSPSPSHAADVPPHLLHQFHAFSLSQLRHHPSLLPTFHAHSPLTFRLHLLPWHPHDNKVLRSYALYAHNFTARLHTFLSSHLSDPLLHW